MHVHKKIMKKLCLSIAFLQDQCYTITLGVIDLTLLVEWSPKTLCFFTTVALTCCSIITSHFKSAGIVLYPPVKILPLSIHPFVLR